MLISISSEVAEEGQILLIFQSTVFMVLYSVLLAPSIQYLECYIIAHILSTLYITFMHVRQDLDEEFELMQFIFCSLMVNVLAVGMWYTM